MLNRRSVLKVMSMAAMAMVINPKSLFAVSTLPVSPEPVKPEPPTSTIKIDNLDNTQFYLVTRTDTTGIIPSVEVRLESAKNKMYTITDDTIAEVKRLTNISNGNYKEWDVLYRKWLNEPLNPSIIINIPDANS